MDDKYQALLAKLKEATGPFGGMEALRLAALTYARPPLSDDEQRACRLLGMALRDGFDATGAALALVEMTLPDWFVERLGDDRKAIRFVGDQHDPTGNWFCAIQHVGGGRLRRAVAPTLPLAVLIAWCEAMIAKEASNGDA